MYFSLGLLYIAAVLEQDGHDVKVWDLRDNDEYTKIPYAQFYGITATTSFEIQHASQLATYLKHRDSNSITIIGGHHCTLFPDECLTYFDVVCVGDGEHAILDIVNNGVRGIVHGQQQVDLNTVPFPARHLVPEDRVFSNALFPGEKYGTGPKATTMITTRNCPFNCAFCPQTYIRRLYKYTIRLRSPENVRDEIHYLQERFNCHHFRFVDDLFTFNKRWMMKTCSLLEPLHIHFRTQTRADILDAEQCDQLKRAGCDEVGLGVESADDDVLLLMNKRMTADINKQAIHLVKDAGLTIKVNWMSGLPGETWSTIEKNKQFMRDTKPDKYIHNMFCPFPGCDIERNPAKYGVRILNRDWSRYYNFTESFIETDVASNQELNDHFTIFDTFLRSEVWRQ